MAEQWIARPDPQEFEAIVYTDDSYLVARVYAGDRRDKYARLIAAAPDLLAALESLTEDPPATLDEPDEDWEVIIKMRAIAREAIAKATT